MKSCFLFSLLCLLLGGGSAHAISSVSLPKQPSLSPSVEISPTLITSLFGNAAGGKKHLNCYNLLNKNWAYPNAQATALCNTAEISCIRHGLLQQLIMSLTKRAVQGKAEGIDLANLKEGLTLTIADVKLTLRGCATALELTSSGESVLDLSGFGLNTPRAESQK